ncbi:kinase-like domain-containing protein [Dichotomocladium elegans]|nr:kinase-like domain-containing protein [Dichotomocladium elegans]
MTNAKTTTAINVFLTTSTTTSTSTVEQFVHTHSDALLDCIVAIYKDAHTLPEIPPFLKQFEPIYKDIARLRASKDDFELIRPLAKGQFAQVTIVRSNFDQQIYAMKTLQKNYILSQRERTSCMEERAVLASNGDNPWFPRLYTAFQDDDYLYLVMEFAGGGDLYSLLAQQQDGFLDEDTARFYIAETILAVDRLHELGYIHRDIKPHNILIDAGGHVKLADFGSCIEIQGNCSRASTLPVGTCDYVSPEVLNHEPYGTEVDWWSVGVVLYELLEGYPPFYGQTAKETYFNIMFHTTVDFANTTLSSACRDLILRLLAKEPQQRPTIDDIKAHPFFQGIDWTILRSTRPPFQPVLTSPDDTSNFVLPDPEEESGNSHDPLAPLPLPYKDQPKHLPFIGFSYQNKESQGQKSASIELTRAMDAMTSRIQRIRAQKLQEEKKHGGHVFREQKAPTTGAKCAFCKDKFWGARASVCEGNRKRT